MKVVERIENIVKEIVTREQYPDELTPIIVSIINRLMDEGNIPDGDLKAQMKRVGSVILENGGMS